MMNSGFKMYLNQTETRFVKEYRAGVIRKNKRIFEKKKLNHLHKVSLDKIFGSNTFVIPPILFLVDFRCYMSLYLYLHIKSKSEPFIQQCHFSKPLEVNITQLAVQTKASRNTIKTGLNELVKLRLAMDMRELQFVKPNAPRLVSIAYDEFIEGYDNERRVVVFRMK
jgi:hypothetical protein